MQTAANRDSPINLRALPTQRALIDRAATLLGKSRSDFMLEVACREATDVLLDQRLFLNVSLFHNKYKDIQLSVFTGINTNVDGKQTRRIARYSGSAPAYRARCDEVAAANYREMVLS